MAEEKNDGVEIQDEPMPTVESAIEEAEKRERESVEDADAAAAAPSPETAEVPADAEDEGEGEEEAPVAEADGDTAAEDTAEAADASPAPEADQPDETETADVDASAKEDAAPEPEDAAPAEPSEAEEVPAEEQPQEEETGQPQEEDAAEDEQYGAATEDPVARLSERVDNLEQEVRAAKESAEETESSALRLDTRATAADIKIRALESQVKEIRSDCLATRNRMRQAWEGGASGTAPAEVPAPPPPDVDALVAKASQQEADDLANDEKELVDARERTTLWAERMRLVSEAIETAVKSADDTLSACADVASSLPTDMRQELDGRQEGLALTGKMISRLPKRLPEEVTLPEVTLPTTSEDAWRKLVEGETDAEPALRKIRQEANRVGGERYKVVSQVRTTADKVRKSVLGFVEKQVLPILDAIDDGEKHSASLCGALREKYPEEGARLQEWCGAYGQLRDLLTDAIGKTTIRRMVVEVGEHIDYDRHEPFDVEPAPELPDESVKEVVRQGYEHDSDNGQSRVLRAAQVVAVKNTDETRAAETEQPVVAASDQGADTQNAAATNGDVAPEQPAEPAV